MTQLSDLERDEMITKNDSAIGRALTEGLLQRHDAWRHQSGEVQRAYEAWIAAEDAKRELAYAGYLAALDQEELAANAYRDELSWVHRIAR